mmetsp:Transcript_34343/g.66907  ORF Transcript_34343/g.66907 Transcript_34343/m.66907 type:complete len:208 (+) Transcript_34343:458-1081(+)
MSVGPPVPAFLSALPALTRGSCDTMRAMICSVLPMPISSARMPPLMSDFSWLTNHPRPSLWYGSMGTVTCLGCFAGFSSFFFMNFGSDGSMALRWSGTSVRTTSCSTSLRSSGLSFFIPWMCFFRSRLSGSSMRTHLRCIQEDIQPYVPPRHLIGAPTRTSFLGIFSEHLRQRARPLLLYSTTKNFRFASESVGHHCPSLSTVSNAL